MATSGACTDSRGTENSEYLMFSTCSMKVNTVEETFGDAYPYGVWGEFKKGVRFNIFENVVALASFNGDFTFFECTGFFIDHVDKCPTILTSASLVRNPDSTDEIIEGLRIKALLSNKECIEGKLEHYSLHYNIILVSAKNYNVDSPASLKHDKIDYYTKVVDLGCRFESGVLMAASGKHTWWLGSLGCEGLRYTTCEITKAGIGGPLVDVNSNFVGMNYYNPKMGTPVPAL
ncbi:hypothetical protein SETIT_6G142000v2 [Setaria italica]|uniref:Uncharacterized protein n=1 Tax=Setaria italica TaxID=4555 RepID=K3YMT9_SETIT|nr:hypothetical protein SETIT_6G142000v2 [Setaria italica]